MGFLNVSSLNASASENYTNNGNGETPKTKEKIKIFPQYSSYSQGEKFQQFTLDVDAAQKKILDDIQNGNISTENKDILKCQICHLM